MSDHNTQALTINQLSLIMTIPEDIVKAANANNFSPAMVETLLRLHNQQKEMETAINELRGIQLSMAQTVDMMTDFSTKLAEDVRGIGGKIGYGQDEQMVTAHDIGQDD